MEREDSYINYKKCVMHVYADHKMGKLVDSLYKVADRVANQNSVADKQRVIVMQEFINLFRRIHQERKLDNIDDILNFIFSYTGMDYSALERVLNTIFFPNEVETDCFISTFIGFREDKLIDKSKEVQCDYLFASVVKGIHRILDNYKKMLDIKFAGREEEYSDDDARDYLLFHGMTSYIGAYLYRNNIDKSLIDSIYDYYLDNFDSISSYYLLNKSDENVKLNNKFKYYIAANMVNDFINDKTNKQIIQ
jgi:hypothetical protein